MVEMESRGDGTILSVQARPGAKKNEIRGEQNGFLKVFVTQIPEKGKANKVILELLAKSLKVKKSEIELVSGETSSHKRFLFHHHSPDEISEKIAPFLPQDDLNR